jgi:glycosyltransferase involved in cell wall biosynthesis
MPPDPASDRMRILADVRCLQDPRFATRGIGSHATSLLRGLRVMGDDVRIVGLFDPQLGPLDAAHAALCDEVRPAFVRDNAVTPAVFLELSPLTHDTLLPARLLDRVNVMPAAVIYDFIPLAEPDRYLPDAAARHGYAAALEWLRAYRVFFPISEPVAAELRTRVGVSPRRTVVTGVAVRDDLVSAAPAAPPAGGADTLFFVGGADPRKNLDTVLTAHGRLTAGGRRLRLVIAGGYPPDWQDRARRTVAAAGGDPASLEFLAHVDDRTLAGLYARARATVVASVAEGFSLPVVEAIACGGVAIVSNTPVHRWLVPDSAACFPPTDAAALAARLARVLDDSAERDRLAAAERDTAARFTQDAVAARFRDGLRAHFEAFVARRSRRRLRRERPAIALATPFPPDRSGVADYTARCVEALGRHADVDIHTEQPAARPSPGVRRIHPLSAAAWLRPDTDATVAVVGNSNFHATILDLHSRFGGACIIHDTRMIDYYAWRLGFPGARAIAARELRRDVTEAELVGWLHHPDTLPTTFFSEILANAHPAIVHSRPLAAQVERRLGRRVEPLPFCVYRQLAEPLLADAARRDARRRLGIPDDAVFVVSFGWVIPSKAPEVIVDAVAGLRRRGVPAHLRFVGDPGGYRDSLTARAGGADIVSFTDAWVDEADYRTYLQAADYAIQLRTLRSGQLSGGLVDCIAAGLPTVANADLADTVGGPGYVLAVPDALTADAITDALATAVAAGLHATRHPEARRAFAAAHSFETYATRLLALLGLADPLTAAGQPA